MTNKVKVNICGKDYNLQTQESPEYVLELARLINRDISSLLKTSETMSITAATTVTALSYLDDLTKLNSNMDNIRLQIKNYVEEAAKARVEAEDLKKQLEASQRRAEELENEVRLLRLRDQVSGAAPEADA